MNILKIMTLAGLGAGMMACASSKQKVEEMSLTGRWDIVAVAGCDSVSAEREPFIDFAESGSLNGCAGCNRLLGNYVADTVKQTLSFGQVGSTRMMCRDMQTEDAVLEAMGKVKAYRMENGNLMLTDNEGKTVLTLKKTAK